jgi:hypothetical protein
MTMAGSFPAYEQLCQQLPTNFTLGLVLATA